MVCMGMCLEKITNFVVVVDDDIEQRISSGRGDGIAGGFKIKHGVDDGGGKGGRVSNNVLPGARDRLKDGVDNRRCHVECSDNL